MSQPQDYIQMIRPSWAPPAWHNVQNWSGNFEEMPVCGKLKMPGSPSSTTLAWVALQWWLSIGRTSVLSNVSCLFICHCEAKPWQS